MKGEQGQVFGSGAGKEAEIFGFKADYELVISLTGEIKENRGGTLALSRFQQKKVGLRIPLLFKP